MDKINIDMYGGKGIFGGKETPLNVDITYCDKYKVCTFYAKGKCFCAGRLKQNCKFGHKQNIQGYTSRAKKYSEFRKKYKEDECYGKLDEPNNIIGQIDDIFVLNTGYLYEDNNKGYYIDTHLGISPLVYVSKEKFTNKLIKLICDAKPKTIFENSEIKAYQEKIIPRFLYELKIEFKEIYRNFIKEYPEYENKKMNFVGRKAYISSLKDGTNLKNDKGDFIKNGLYLECKKWRSAFLPFNAEETELRIKITEKMTTEITDNNQVDENTRFED